MQNVRNIETNLLLSFMAMLCVGCLWGLSLCLDGVSPTIATSRSLPFDTTGHWGGCLSEALLGVIFAGVDSTICTSRSFPFEATAHQGLECHGVCCGVCGASTHCSVLTGG